MKIYIDSKAILYLLLSIVSVVCLFISFYILDNMHGASASARMAFGALTMLLFISLTGYYNIKAKHALQKIRDRKPRYVKTF